MVNVKDAGKGFGHHGQCWTCGRLGQTSAEDNVNMVWSRERCGRGEPLERGALDRGQRDGDVQGVRMAEAREGGARDGEVHARVRWPSENQHCLRGGGGPG